MGEYICSLCPRNCHAVRTEEGGQGVCRMGILPKVARAAPHFWEEPCISGTKGSGTIFFSGCVLSCVFCYRPPVPVVYNTGGYEKTETLRRLEGLVDVYLPDFKYIRPEVSAKYSHAADYAAYALPAIHEMVRQTGRPVFDDNGLLLKGTVVRHLILPQNTRNSIEVLDTLQREFGDSILVSLMGQYIPMGRAADFPEINRRITRREYEKVLLHYEDLGLDGFVQELSSANVQYVPDFSDDDPLKGVNSP